MKSLSGTEKPKTSRAILDRLLKWFGNCSTTNRRISGTGRKVVELQCRTHGINDIGAWTLGADGTGVEPDVKVKATDALATAEKLAESKLQGK